MDLGIWEVQTQGDLSLDSWGHLHLVEGSILELEAQGIGTIHFRTQNGAGDNIVICYAWDRTNGRMIFAFEEGSYVYVLDIPELQLIKLTTLNRDYLNDPNQYNPGGLYRMKMIETSSALLIIYEGGIICLDLGENIGIRWRRDHQYFDWFFDSVRANVVWYTSEHDGRWGYRLTDGTRLENNIVVE
jgi:hypothetical protein